MARHYLKIPSTIQAYYPGGAPEDWRVKAFEDATEGGKRLVLTPLPANDQGVRASVFGEDLYFEIGRDRNREDTIFVTRIERGRNPSQTPRALDCEIRLWPGGVPPTLDSVRYLFSSSAVASEALPEVPESRLTISDDLVEFLAEVPATQRPGLRPRWSRADLPTWLEMMGRLWTRHSLERFVEPSERELAILTGRIQPAQLADEERVSITALVSILALDRMLSRGSEREAMALLQSFDGVDEPLVGLLLWPATLPDSAQALSMEVRESIPIQEPLEALTLESLAFEAWRPVLLERIRSIGDEQLASELVDAPTAVETLKRLANWAVRRSPSAQPPPPVEEARLWREAAEAWVLKRKRLVERLPSHCAELRAIGVVASSFDAPATVDALVQFRELGSQLRGMLDEILEELPEADELEKDVADAEAALLRMSAVLGPATGQFLARNSSVSASEVASACHLMEARQAISVVPLWMWPSGIRPADAEGTFQALLSPGTAYGVSHFIDLLGKLGQPAAAAWLPPLPPGRPVEEHLNEWFDKAKAFFLDVPLEIQQVMRHGNAGDVPIAVLLSNAAQMNQLREQLPATHFAEVVARLREVEPEMMGLQLGSFVKAADFLARHVGPLDQIGWPAYIARFEKEESERADVKASIAAPTVRIKVNHNFVSSNIDRIRAERAHLHLVRLQDGSDLAEVRVPLVLQADFPQRVSLRIDWSVRGRLQEAWPKDWPVCEPSEVLDLYPHDWRSTPSGPYQYAFPASIPVRVSATQQLSKLEVTAVVKDLDGASLSLPELLQWEDIRPVGPPLSVKWADATNPDNIRTNPIGPQAEVANVLGRLKGGSSVAVIAPRRFGKTTLAEYLTREGAAHGLAITPAVWCHEFWTPTGMDYSKLWARLSDHLRGIIGAEIGSSRRGDLPGEDAFNHIRQKARERGFKAVVLLFDEAQLFLPTQDGYQFSAALKMLLERHWAKDGEGMVPLLFCLVGLPSLRPRIGADLMGLLSPIERSEMVEEDLRRLVANIAPGLQTTRDARQQLAQASGNLFLLKVLLERLVIYLNREQRSWAAYSDVFHVEESLRQDLQRSKAESSHVIEYVRDVLNEAERVEEWKPVPAFPVAVAASKLRQAGSAIETVVAPIVDLLNEWCESAGDAHVRPRFDRQGVFALLGALRDRGVLQDDGFRSRLLEAWLSGVAGRLAGAPIDEAFKAALLKGAERRIRIPDAPVVFARGGEAELIREDGRVFRVRALDSETDRRRYLESKIVTERVKAIVAEGLPGTQFMFQPIDLGLSERDARHAVQVYRWVEGRDLDDRSGQMQSDEVVDIGHKLSLALRLLHRNGIIHRDICPRNIILAEEEAETLRPVLIDFGFARISESATLTRLAGEHLAPEVCVTPPVWSKASDVYALGWTLRRLVVADADDTTLAVLLDEMTAINPDERPGVDAVVRRFEELSMQRSIEERQARAFVELRRRLAEQPRWVMDLLRDHRSIWVGLEMGWSTDSFDRCRTIADLLNLIAEASVRYGGARLEDMKAAATEIEGQMLDYVWALRNSRSHAIQVQYSNTRRQVEAFRGLAREEQEVIIRGAAALIGKRVKFPALEAEVTRFVGEGARRANRQA